MNKNEISQKTLNADANLLIEQLQNVLLIEHKAKASARNYVNEMVLYLRYYIRKKSASIEHCLIKIIEVC